MLAFDCQSHGGRLASENRGVQLSGYAALSQLLSVTESVTKRELELDDELVKAVLFDLQTVGVHGTRCYLIRFWDRFWGRFCSPLALGVGDATYCCCSTGWGTLHGDDALMVGDATRCCCSTGWGRTLLLRGISFINSAVAPIGAVFASQIRSKRVGRSRLFFKS
jgi:hypothetical protein